MSKLIGTLTFFVTFLLSATAAHAATTDCATNGCEIALQDDGAHFYNKASGAEVGLTGSIGTGNGTVSPGNDGYSFVTHGSSSGILWILDAKTGGSCNITVGPSLGYSLQFGNDGYTVASGVDTVAKTTMTCSGGVGISVGDQPTSMATDGTTIYVLNSGDGTISTIVPPSETAVTYGIGRSGLDFLANIEYNASNNKLYVTGLAGIYEVDLPLTLGTSVLWQALPNGIGKLSQNNNYFAVNDSSNDAAYLIEKASPTTYNTIPCMSCRSADLSDDTLFTTGGFTPDVGVRAWDLTGTELPFSPITTTNTWSSAYLPPFTPLGPVCQNGVKEAGEECDQSDFGSSTCGTEGFDGGSLSCSASCTIVNTACTYTCGNNVAAPTEECDGSDLKGQDCTTIPGGFTGGTLACNGCSFDTSGCTVAPTCNDGNIDTGEDCDGANLGNATCETEGYFAGTLGCTAGCQFDYSNCTNCGNGTADASEECDGADLNGQDCTGLGFDSGTLACNASCTYNTGSCVLDSCGDGVINNGETCDDDNNTSGDGCSNVCQIETGWMCSGTPSVCTQICGNNAIDTGEECDGANLGDATCADFGGEGDLSCKSDCTLDTSGCLACNDPQIVFEITVNDLNQDKLKDYDAELFTNNLAELNESGGLMVSCGNFEVQDQTVPSVVIDIAMDEYQMLRITNGAFTEECMFYAKGAPAKLFVSIADPKKRTITSSADAYGLVCDHNGTNVQNDIEGVLFGTLGTTYSFSYVNYNPVAQQTGNWIAYHVSDSAGQLSELGNPSNQSDPIFAASFSDGKAKYVNMDAANDYTTIGRKPADKPSCNCSTTEPGAAPILMLVIFFLFWSWRRSRHLSMQKIKTTHRDH